MEHLTSQQKEELKGKRIKLVSMDDPHTNLESGDMGTCTGVDDMNQLLMKWDRGSSLSLLPDIDEWEVIEESSNIIKFERFIQS